MKNRYSLKRSRGNWGNSLKAEMNQLISFREEDFELSMIIPKKLRKVLELVPSCGATSGVDNSFSEDDDRQNCTNIDRLELGKNVRIVSSCSELYEEADIDAVVDVTGIYTTDLNKALARRDLTVEDFSTALNKLRGRMRQGSILLTDDKKT